MTFEEWTATYCNCMLREGDTAEDRLTRLVARDAWKAAEAATREDMLTQWNRAGVDIDAALHGRVNEKSPIANRLRMIAAAQPKWQSIETCPSDGRPVLVYRPLAMRTHDPLVTIKLAIGGNHSCFPETVPPGSAPTNPTDGGCHATHWMPLPPEPEKTVTGEKEQEARDVTD